MFFLCVGGCHDHTDPFLTAFSRNPASYHSRSLLSARCEDDYPEHGHLLDFWWRQRGTSSDIKIHWFALRPGTTMGATGWMSDRECFGSRRGAGQVFKVFEV